MDILPYSPDTISTVLKDAEQTLITTDTRRLLLNVDDATDWCIFCVEVRNTYGLPFEVSFERVQSDANPTTITNLVAPGSTSRILLPIRKIRLPEEQVSRPIPTLSDRQFIVAKSNLSDEEEKTQRELFWYREELFKCVRGHWKENGGSRNGDLSLRRQRMTQHMLDVLRTQPVRVQLSIWRSTDSGEAAEPLSWDEGIFYPPLNEFVSLRIKLTNLSPSPLTLTVDLTLEPAQYILYEGVLSGIPVGRIEVDQVHEFELPVTFVSCGRFDIQADVHVYGDHSNRSKLARGRLRAAVEES